MNSFVIDPTLIKFKGPNYARFCGKFTISTPVMSGVWSQGQRLCSVSLRTDVSQPTALNVGSTYEISGEVEGLNAYLMPILKWNGGDERVTRINTRLADRSPVRFSGVGTIVTWQRFVINPLENRDLIQAVVGASPLLVFVRLLLGWNYCHVDQAINAFEGSRIAYVGSMQGRDKGDGTPIVEVPKATLNFVGGMLDRGEECLETELSDDFN
ncbi:hypothetical protein PSTG_07598 [Puccinia striiformis f. sp. tritici PST-78]|uniref:Uncharacterized protein n=1 Tax=Puccinia striiformis f. sp. tritici PST-78 TaxID=1165861 RepID=A0A0L0VJE8_9BASI|nr:hypothetical protein PSTG_07598 [Puccinia striiformis f. sp. tritici PST-78]